MPWTPLNQPIHKFWTRAKAFVALFDVCSQTTHEEQTNANHGTPRPRIPESVKFGGGK